MKEKKVTNFLKRKDVLLTLGFTLVALLVLTGIVALQENRNGGTEDEQVAELEETNDNELALQETETEDKVDGIASDADNARSEASSIEILTQEEVDEILANNNDMDVPEEILNEIEEREAADVSSNQVEAEVETALNFTDDDMLAWPIQGNVVLDYSMDKSVYFSTLNQYKYNPALIISAEVNAQVVAAADGVVESVEVNEETGTTVVTDLGNGFKAVYGQLKEVPVTVGDTIIEGQAIGYISEPTRYYSVEGSNLYFQLTKEEDPVDPMTFLP